MGSRIVLQNILEEILQSKNVYFQPPENIRMKYPAIVYSLEGIDSRYADNLSYRTHRKYIVTLIDIDPDSDLVDELTHFPICQFNRHYSSENLNHWVFSLYF